MGTLVIAEPGARLVADGRRLLVTRAGTLLRKIRAHEVSQVMLLGPIEASASAIALCLREQIDVVFLTGHGRYRGRLLGRATQNSQLRLTQYRAVTDNTVCARLARGFIAGKITNQRAILLRFQRRFRGEADERVAGALPRLRDLVTRLDGHDDLDTLRGLEGSAAAAYFGVFGRLVRNHAFSFETRNRRPPTDPINACLSFGYTMLGVEAENRAHRVGLDPQLGFFHQPAHGRPSLVLDVIEEFRPVIDRLVLRLINRRQLSPTDFGAPGADDEDPSLETDAAPEPSIDPPLAETPDKPAAVYLSDSGRRVFLSAFFKEMRTKRYHEPVDQQLELGAIIESQFRSLARILGGSGVAYVPFRLASH